MTTKKLIFLTLTLMVMLVAVGLIGCNTFKEKVEMKNFEHQEGGYSFKIPIDWEKIEEDDVKVIFRDEEEAISFYAREELGGMTIYAPHEVSERVVNEFEDVLTDVKILREAYSYSMDNAYRIILEGKLDGHEYIVTVFIREQDLGIRHYLVFFTPATQFYQSEYLFEDVAGSFKLTKEEMDFYQELNPHYDIEEELEEMEEKQKEKESDENPE